MFEHLLEEIHECLPAIRGQRIMLDVVLPRVDHIELRRQDVHGFTARPLELDDPDAAAAEYPLMADHRQR